MSAYINTLLDVVDVSAAPIEKARRLFFNVLSILAKVRQLKYPSSPILRGVFVSFIAEAKYASTVKILHDLDFCLACTYIVSFFNVEFEILHAIFCLLRFVDVTVGKGTFFRSYILQHLDSCSIHANSRKQRIQNLLTCQRSRASENGEPIRVRATNLPHLRYAE